MAVLIWLVLAFFMAAWCGDIADQKGQKGGPWGLAGFFFGPLALVAVAALPDLVARRHLSKISGINDDG